MNIRDKSSIGNIITLLINMTLLIGEDLFLTWDKSSRGEDNLTGDNN